MIAPRTIYGIGRNYSDHARELGNPVPTEPVIFLKPGSSVVDGSTLALPKTLGRVDPEVELVICLGRGGKGWSVQEAQSAIGSYAVGLDLTARDRQTEAKSKGLPWTRAKGFYGSAVVGNWVAGVPAGETAISLQVNGDLRQEGRAEEMLWSPAEILSHLSQHFLLETGDWVFTGTPAGVGPISHGDHLDARAGTSHLALTVEFTP